MSENEILAKLRVKSGQRAIILGAPESYGPVLAALPQGVEVASALEGQFDFIHYFVAQKAEVERKVPQLKAAMKPGGILWISYPKGSAVPTDLKRDILREVVEGFGLKAVSMVAIDDVWAAMRFKSV